MHQRKRYKQKEKFLNVIIQLIVSEEKGANRRKNWAKRINVDLKTYKYRENLFYLKKKIRTEGKIEQKMINIMVAGM